MSSLFNRIRPQKDEMIAHTSSTDSGSNGSIDEKRGSVVTATGAELPQDEAQANETLKKIRDKHRWDPNFEEDLDEELEHATEAHDANGELRLVGELVENSPYPEVRAAVRNVSQSAFSSHPSPLTKSYSMMTTFPLIRPEPGYWACF